MSVSSGRSITDTSRVARLSPLVRRYWTSRRSLSSGPGGTLARALMSQPSGTKKRKPSSLWKTGSSIRAGALGLGWQPSSTATISSSTAATLETATIDDLPAADGRQSLKDRQVRGDAQDVDR